MSGHSKWAQIKRQKAVVDAKRGQLYAKIAREIIVASRLGGGDPAANFRLRQAVERARAEGVPNENIQRAIEKGTGAGGSDNLEELIYEGYGPGGVAIMMRCATDNRNRTAADLRSSFSKHGGNLGETGCVSWMFKERGEIVVKCRPLLSEDDLFLAALEAGADDIEAIGPAVFTVVCGPAKLERVRDSLVKGGYDVASAQVSRSPLSVVPVTDQSTARQLLRLLDALENHDDVQELYANFDMDTSLLEACMA